MLDRQSTGAPPCRPYVTNDAHGSPAAVNDASVAVLVDTAMVRASSAADGRTELTTGFSGGGTDGASPGSPWSREATSATLQGGPWQHSFGAGPAERDRIS